MKTLKKLVRNRPARWSAVCSLLLLLGTACGRQQSATPTLADIVPVGTTGQRSTAQTAIPIAATAATVTPQTVVVQRVARPTTAIGVLALRVTPVDMARELPLLTAHLARVRAILLQPIPILPLIDGLDSDQLLAQEIALADPRFTTDTHDPQTGEPLRSEIFGIYPVRPSDTIAETAACANIRCYRVERYHYAYNASTIAIVDLAGNQLLTVNRLVAAQPDIPPHLTLIAQEIAANAPEVAAALGLQPALIDATMANIKSALNESRCERSNHLCVAPTFMAGDRALWAIVDLTEGTVVGVRWTNLGTVGGAVTMITEKLLQDEVVTSRYCEQSTSLAQDGWAFDYILTSSDGLLIRDLRFGDQPVLESAKLVDWHVSYSNTDGFGYSDAIGCPIFSQAAVVAFNGPQVKEILEGERVVGFALTQDYKSEVWPAPCNYYYSQRYEFYQDGRFRIVAANHGRGCGDHGTYRPVVRIVPAGTYTFATWDGTAWDPWQTEQWTGPSESVTADGYQYQLLDAAGSGYWVAPGRGQFGDGGRGDNPYVYLTRHHALGTGPDEGDSDLITIGPCCNDDYQQGPEKFIDTPPEALDDGAIVIWYVAQMENDDRPGQEYCWADAVLQEGVYVPVDYPCLAGPMFVPIVPMGD